MAVETVTHLQNTTAVTDQNWSPAIWGDCPVIGLKEGSVNGIIFEDDFLSFPKTPATTEGNFGQYAQFSSTGGTITAGTGQGGEMAIGSDGDDEGASIRTVATPFKIIRTAGTLWFECRIKSSTITDTKHNILIGLMEDTALTATVPITAAGAIADKNLVGFRRTEAASGGALIDFVYKADGVTAVTQQAAIATLVADTYVKLGFKFEVFGTKGSYYLTSYVNNVAQTTAKQIPSAAGTDFPNDVGLGLFFAVLNATGTTPGTSTIDKWRCAQLYV
jgi:hypothetical protein